MDMFGDRLLPETVDEVKGGRQANRAGIIRCPTGFVAASRGYEGVILNRGYGGGLEVFPPPARRILDGEIAGERWPELCQ